MKGKSREEYLLPPRVAFTPERVNLGGWGAKWWQRPEPPVGQERTRQPIDAQESARWLAGDPLAGAVQQRGPDTLVVNIAERAGAMRAWVLEAMRRVPEERAECSSRAKGHRRLGTGPAPPYVWEVRQKAHAAGRLC